MKARLKKATWTLRVRWSKPYNSGKSHYYIVGRGTGGRATGEMWRGEACYSPCNLLSWTVPSSLAYNCVWNALDARLKNLDARVESIRLTWMVNDFEFIRARLDEIVFTKRPQEKLQTWLTQCSHSGNAFVFLLFIMHINIIPLIFFVTYRLAQADIEIWGRVDDTERDNKNKTLSL